MAIGTGPYVGALAGQYVQRLRRQGRMVGVTATNYRSILGAFVKAVGDRPVDRLGRRQVERWQDTLGPLAKSTQRQRVCVVRGFCDWLLREGHVNRDLMADVPTPREPRRLPRGIPKGGDGVAQLLALGCPDARARLIVTLQIQCGLRCGETHALQVHDIDTNERSVRVVGKGKHERVVRLTDEAALALTDYLAEYPAAAGPLIRSYKRPRHALSADTISGLVSGWMSAAGIKQRPRDGVSAHALRHQAAHDMLRAGASPVDVQHVLGHRHLSTTQIYLPRLVEPLALIMEGRWYGRRRPSPAAETDRDEVAG